MNENRKTLNAEGINKLLLDEYFCLVDTLFSEKSPILIPNCSIDHAAVINQLIVKHAPDNGNVYFFSKNFDPVCFEKPCFLEQVKSALKRNIRFHLACTEKCKSPNFLQLLGLNGEKQDVSRECTATSLHEFHENALVPLSDKTKKELNFSTNDIAVRVEKDASVAVGDVSGNDPSAAQKLIQIFNLACS